MLGVIRDHHATDLKVTLEGEPQAAQVWQRGPDDFLQPLQVGGADLASRRALDEANRRIEKQEKQLEQRLDRLEHAKGRPPQIESCSRSAARELRYRGLSCCA